MADAAWWWLASLGAACLLDALVGDPPVPWHPVRLIGRLALALEAWSRRRFAPRAAGAVSWGVAVGLVGGLAFNLSGLAWRIGPAAGIPVDALLLWSAMAPRDLAVHAGRVWRRLGAGDLPGARAALAMIVGRRTEDLDRSAVVRAGVEAVSESLVDGVLAPLFWALLLGPAAALAYRAVNTMDSIFGHLDERYRDFGYTAAKADDLANLLPARLSIACVLPAAGLLGLDLRGAWRIFRRDRLRHASPNAAHAEAAFAGALGLRLGGPTRYAEGLVDKPWLGDGDAAPAPAALGRSIALMLLATLVGVCLVGAGRALLLNLVAVR